MDRVKMRRPVRPGDQLVLEAEALHARSRTGHCKCRALIENEVAAEAEIKFMLVDNEPI
jgi:UDP-3-O-[3-hydroxymyristoyl] N-acetylglucosamine deacetylase/3-hydroxyacyl-[acyl-carrier-protein] dehydratase